MEHFGETLSSLRKQNNMTQKELASVLHVSDKVISKWELGQSEPDLFTLKQIAQIFNISVAKLLGEKEAEPTKVDLNTKLYNFFKRNYMTIIQLVVLYAGVIAACAGYGYLCGYDIVINILPDYALGILLIFSIVAGILHGIVVLTDRGHIAATILKSILLAVYSAMLIASFVLLSMVKNEFYKDLCIVSGVAYSLFFIAGVLSLLVDVRVIKTKAPFKLGKILFIVVLAFLGFSSGLVISNVATISVAVSRQVYKENTATQLKFYKEDFTFYNVGDSAQLVPIYQTGKRKDKIIYSSSNDKVATVDDKGRVTVTGYGVCYIYGKMGNVKAVCCVYVDGLRVVDIQYDDQYWKSDNIVVGASRTLEFAINRYQEYNNLNSDRFEFYTTDEVDFQVLEQTYNEGKLKVTFKVGSMGSSTKYTTQLYVKDKLYDYDIMSFTLECQALQSFSIGDIKDAAVGEAREIKINPYPSQCIGLKYDFSLTQDTDVAEILPDGRIYFKKQGEVTLQATSETGLVATKVINVTKAANYQVSSSVTSSLTSRLSLERTNSAILTISGNEYFVNKEPEISVADNSVIDIVKINETQYRVLAKKAGYVKITFKLYEVEVSHWIDVWEKDIKVAVPYNLDVIGTGGLRIYHCASLNDMKVKIEILNQELVKFKDNTFEKEMVLSSNYYDDIEFKCLGRQGVVKFKVTVLETGETVFAEGQILNQG